MQGSAAHYYDIPLLGSKDGCKALATKNIYYIMATQNSLFIDRKRSRPDITTTDFDSAQICSWPTFLLIKGTNDERSLCKLSPFAVNKAFFYCVNTSYPMDNCFTGRRDRSRQTTEKVILYKIPAGPVTECTFARCRLVHTSCLDRMTSRRLFRLARECTDVFFAVCV